MTNFYVNCKSVSEVMKWYLTSESMTCLPSSSSLHSCAYHTTSETDLINLAGNLSIELCRLGKDAACILRSARYSSLLLLLGAGGVAVYYLRHGGGRPQLSPLGGKKQNRSSPRRPPKSFLSWLFEEELVEDFSKDSYFLRSHYFGPSLSSPETAADPVNREHHAKTKAASGGINDVSLNSLNLEATPRRFLERPLFDIRQRGRTQQYLERGAATTTTTPVYISNPCPRCVKGNCRLKKHQFYNGAASSSSSNYSGSPQNRTNASKQKTSTPDLEERQGGGDHHHSLSGLFGFGCSKRMDGDGSDEMDPAQLSDELNKYSGTPVGFLRGEPYRPSYRLYGPPSRGLPDGKERQSLSPSQSCSRSCSPSSELNRQGRDESNDSSDHEVPSVSASCSISGSMVDMIKNAREVRRLIRETSIDSLASDLSLDLSLNDQLGGSTAEELNALCRGMGKLIDNCGNLEEEFRFIPDQPSLPASRSTMSGLSQYTEEATTDEDTAQLKRDSSIPDLRELQRTLRSNKGMWRLTNISGVLDREASRQASITSDAGSFEWDSPTHGWHDLKPAAARRTPMLYSSTTTSESGDEVGSFAGSGLDSWEWDDCYYVQDGGGESIELLGGEDPGLLAGHRSWLPADIGTAELDLETELRLREFSSCSTSNRSSFDRDVLALKRLPPSGRSSVAGDKRHGWSSRSSSISDDMTITAPNFNKHHHPSKSRSRSRDASPILPNSRGRNSSIGSELDIPEGSEENIDSGLDVSSSSAGTNRSVWSSSQCSLDTGLSSMDTSVSSTASSILFQSTTNLSPVKEAREPPASPVKGAEPPTSPMSTSCPLSPEVVFGNIAITDTVIKVSVPPSGDNGPVQQTSEIRKRSLFPTRLDELNDNSVVLLDTTRDYDKL